MVTSFRFLRCLTVIAATLAPCSTAAVSGAGPAELMTDSSSAPAATAATADSRSADDSSTEVGEPDHDRLWLISTRHLQRHTRCANLDDPQLRVWRLDSRGHRAVAGIDDYLATRQSDRPVVVYVHGNRMDYCDAVERGLFVYRQVASRRCHAGPIDWVIWSWPSDQEGILLRDVREKARRTDTQGLFLAWLLRQHVHRDQPTALIGYSFGGRVVSGALHALAGGPLGGRRLPGESLTGAGIDVGMVAPALESDWMSSHGYHRFATQNLDRLVLLYNQDDTILKNYWRIRGIRNADALGYSGPTSFAPRADGSQVPVRSRDCSNAVGWQHREVDYYNAECSAGIEMASLIHGCLIPDTCRHAGR